MSVQYFKESGKYYIVIDNKPYDITDFFEQEIKHRDEVNAILKEYFDGFSQEQMHELLTLKVRNNTMKKYMSELISKSDKMVEDWFRDGNCYGSSLSVKNNIAITKKWLENIDKK